MAGAQANIRNFYAPLNGPGRSAASLLEDLILYDPRQATKDDYHLLEDGPKGADRAQFIGQLLPEASCLHDFCLKPRQSLLPALDEIAGSETVWQAAAICRNCRLHLLLKVDYSVAYQTEPCPRWESPLHHLVRSSWREEAWTRDLANDGNCMDEIHVYECSSRTCSAIVSIQLSTPIFTDEALRHLVDRDLLNARAKAAFEQKKGQTDGMKWPLPIDVLTDLQAYIRNAWRMEKNAEIDLNNKRFVVRFGPDGTACGGVLEMLGFELRPGKSWVVPKPDHNDQLPFSHPDNVFLDNVEAELSVLIANRPQEERETVRDKISLEPALIAMSRVLSCQNYDLDPAYRTKRKPLPQRSRSFNILGIPEAASDDLIIWAYQRQIAVLGDDDPKQTAKLMTALEDIQQSRQSDALSNHVAIERSLGRFGERTVADAYRSLGLYANPSIDDDFIIGTFTSRVTDAPAQEDDMRQSLLAIGEFRNSKKLIDFARKTITSYEDALTFLGAESSTDDSFITSIYADRASSSPSDREMAQKALQIIADHRNSRELKYFIASDYQGEIAQTSMDIGEAFSLLDVEDRTLEDDALYVVYEMRLADESPMNHARLRKAIETIAEEKNSALLKEKLNMPAGPKITLSQQPLTEPIGLDNIGNTCYLNSLLQWLFTIVSVRTIVLDYNQYRQIADELHTKTKRVGHREVKPKEVQNAQKFVEQLAELFQQMIVSPQRTIRPTQELARRTLEITDATARRSSTLIQNPRRGTLGTIDGRQVFGPLPPPAETFEQENPLQSPDELDPNTNPMSKIVSAPKVHAAVDVAGISRDDPTTDNASETTLVSENDQTVNSDLEMKDDLDKVKDGSSIGGDSPVLVSVEDNDEIQSSNTSQQEYQMDTKDGSEGQADMIEITTPNAQKQSQTQDSPTQLDKQEDVVMTDIQDRQQSKTISPEPSKTNSTNEEPPKAPIKYLPPPGPPPPVPPRKPAPSGVSTSTLEQYARQQDVTEVLEYVIHQLSCAVRPKGIGRNGEQQDEIHDTFHGENQEHKVDKDNNLSHREPEQFLFHQTQISNEPKDLYAALDNYFDLEDRGTNKVYNTIAKLPPVLCLALGRAVHDYKTGQNIKVNCHVDLPNTLFMDRYLDAPSDSSLATRRQQKWTYKEELIKLQTRLAKLEPQGKEPVDEALSAAVAAVQHLTEIAATEDIQSLNMPSDMINDMAELSRKTREERLHIKNRINVLEQQINDSFTDAAFRKQEYKLHAAFFHRGSAGSGHYWIYIFDHVNEIWRKYNDDVVTQVSNLQEIFGNPRDQGNPFYSTVPNSNPPNPYFLVYVRNDHLKSQDDNQEPIVETVKREPIAIPADIQNDHQNMSSSTQYDNSNQAESNIHPLGTDTPTTTTTHNGPNQEWTEFAAPQTQMSYMPPGGSDIPRIEGQEPNDNNVQEGQAQFANIGSVIQRKEHDASEEGEELDWETKEAIAQSLQGSSSPSKKPVKVGDWDDSENTSVPAHAW